MRLVTNTIPLLSPLTGVGNYTNSLVNEFLKLSPDLASHYYYGYFTRNLNSKRARYFQYLVGILKKMPPIYLPLRQLNHLLAPLQLRNYDVYFEPNFIPLSIRSKKIVTTVHDFSFYLYPQWLPRERQEHFSRHFFKRIERSDLIITVSEHINSEAREILKMSNGRIVTIPSGYNSDVFHTGRPVGRTASNYILFVGSIEPRKNLQSLLKAYMMLPESIRKEFKLILAGFEGWKNREFMEQLDKLKGSVEYLGYVNDEILANLYRSAACFVYPSYYEGFGLPPLEAMACGCPAIVSNTSSLPEVCGDAAYFVDPHKVESISEGIYNVLTDSGLRERLISQGLERVKLFSWKKSAKEHLRLIEEIAKS